MGHLEDGKTLRPLTPRQRAVLEFIVRYQDEHGMAPSIREIMARFGLGSTNAADVHLRALVRKGYLRRRDRAARSLVVVQQPQPHAMMSGKIRLPGGYAVSEDEAERLIEGLQRVLAERRETRFASSARVVAD